MKRHILLGAVATVALSSINILQAQSQSTAVGLTALSDARGSSRYQALSGAMGAVGTDFSAVHQNPAGLSFFRSGSKISATLSYGMHSSSNEWYGNKTSLDSRNKLYFDELSYMTNWGLGSGKNLTFGFALHNSGRLNRRMDAFTGRVASGLGSSVTDYVAALSNNDVRALVPEGLHPKEFPQTSWENPWISVLGYTAGWVDADMRQDASKKPYYHYKGMYGGNPEGASLVYDEQGAISHYDIGLGLELGSSFSLGFLGTLSSMNYEVRSFYKEEFGVANAAGQPISLSLDNALSISSFGARLGLGVLVRPTESLRLGGAIYTPHFWSHSMSLSAVATGVANNATSGGGREEVGTPVSETPFRLNTPWRFTLNGVYVFGRTGLVSLDYEYQDFGGARLQNSSEDDYDYGRNVYQEENDAIKSDFGGQHTLRVGLEVNATKRLALRAGMRYSSAPKLDVDLKGDVARLEQRVPSTHLHYRLPGAIESYSLGLGYRLSRSWTLDVAYILRQQKDKVGAYPFIRDVATKSPAYPNGEARVPLQFIKDKQVQSSISATLSYRF